MASNDDNSRDRTDAVRWSMRRRLLWLLLVPLLLIGPSLRPGHRFLPQAPVMYAPLAAEYPEAAERARDGANLWTGDRIFPVLTDQLELRRRGPNPAAWVWDEDQGLGQPLLGNAIHGPLYPPNLLLLALPPDLAAGPLAMLALVLAGAGLWAFLARLGFGERSCLMAALSVQAVGWGVTNLHYGMKVDAALWLPWCLWALEGLRGGRRGSGPWLAAFCALSALAGFPPITAFVLGVVVLAAGLRLGPTRNLVTASGAVVLGLAVAAVQLGSTLGASNASYRVPKDRAALASEASVPSANLALVVPELFGRPTEPRPAFGPVAAWWLAETDDWERTQNANALEWDTYAGLVVVLLALAGLVGAPRRAAPPIAILLLAHGFAQGWPGFSLLYALPGLDGGAPTRALAVAWTAWPWAAAVGFEALGFEGLGLDARARSEPPLARAASALGGRSALGFAALLGLTLGAVFADSGALIASQERRYAEGHDRPLDEVRLVLPPEEARRTADRLALGFAWTGSTAALLAAASLTTRRRRFVGVASAVPIALLLVELLDVSRVHTTPRDLGGLPLFPESTHLTAVADAAGDGRVIRYDPSPSGTEFVERLARPNLLQAYGIGDVSTYVAFTPRATVDHFTEIDPRFRVRSGVGRLPDTAHLDHPALDAARVTAVLATEPLEHPQLELTHAAPGFAVHTRTLGPYDPPTRSLFLDRPAWGWTRDRLQEARSSLEFDFLLGAWVSSLALVGLIAWAGRDLRRGAGVR